MDPRFFRQYSDMVATAEGNKSTAPATSSDLLKPAAADGTIAAHTNQHLGSTLRRYADISNGLLPDQKS
jgi:hypothetical protein